MTANTLEERRRFVEQVKASFHNPSESARYRDVRGESGGSEETDVFSGSKSGWKWRLMAALLLFGGFIYVSQNQIKVGDVTAVQVAEYLSQDMSLEKLTEYLPDLR